MKDKHLSVAFQHDVAIIDTYDSSTIAANFTASRAGAGAGTYCRSLPFKVDALHYVSSNLGTP
jgi:hypothetical protein